MMESVRGAAVVGVGLASAGVAVASTEVGVGAVGEVGRTGAATVGEGEGVAGAQAAKINASETNRSSDFLLIDTSCSLKANSWFR
jgi:hypothetical protein